MTNKLLKNFLIIFVFLGIGSIIALPLQSRPLQYQIQLATEEIEKLKIQLEMSKTQIELINMSATDIASDIALLKLKQQNCVTHR